MTIKHLYSQTRFKRGNSKWTESLKCVCK